MRRGCIQSTRRVHLEYLAGMIGEVVPLDATGYLLYSAMLPRQGILAALLNPWKQTQEVAKMR